MTAVPLTTFLRDRAQHIGDNIDTSKAVDLAVPRIHYESQDLLATASNCVDWRGEILMSALDAHGSAPDIAVGAVECCALWPFDCHRPDRYLQGAGLRSAAGRWLANFSPSRSLRLAGKTSRPGLALHGPLAGLNRECQRAERMAVMTTK